MSGTSLVPYQKKKNPLSQSAVDTTNEIVPPLDYSFCQIENIKDAENEEPRPSISPRKGKQAPIVEEGTKSQGKCLKLNNNNITNLECLVDFVKFKFEMWQDLAWIDLSQNELTTIGSELTEFTNLQILYLHGNQLSDIRQVEQLTPLKCLRKLTLHANPIENEKGYRSIVLSILPNLQSLDFSCVTKADRKTAQTWFKMNGLQMKKKKPKSEEEE